MEVQLSTFNTELSDACDEIIQAAKQARDAADHLNCCKERCAKLLKEHGLEDKQYITHEGKRIVFKEGKITPDSVAIKDEKGGE
jgi:hypothetical protein